MLKCFSEKTPRSVGIYLVLRHKVSIKHAWCSERRLVSSPANWTVWASHFGKFQLCFLTYLKLQRFGVVGHQIHQLSQSVIDHDWWKNKRIEGGCRMGPIKCTKCRIREADARLGPTVPFVFLFSAKTSMCNFKLRFPRTPVVPMILEGQFEGFLTIINSHLLTICLNLRMFPNKKIRMRNI